MQTISKLSELSDLRFSYDHLSGQWILQRHALYQKSIQSKPSQMVPESKSNRCSTDAKRREYRMHFTIISNYL